MEVCHLNKHEAAVTVDNVSLRLGKVKALKEVSFTVKPGELFGIVGADGAGKSTLFRILATLLVPDTGTACLCGLDVRRDYRLLRARLGYMPGRFALYPDLSVEENIRFFATVFHTTLEDNYDRVADIYRQIEPFAQRRAGALSGGMKQKLALCCALIHRPDILLLDEPTTGVDPVSRHEFWAMLRALKAQGMTILVSTPVMEDARLCDRIAFLDQGMVKAVDRPETVLSRFSDILCPEAPVHDTQAVAEEYAIDVQGLTKMFGTFTAVDHINVQVCRGEVFGFLGANGAGKTTAMRMLCGLSIPTAGTGKVAGLDIHRQTEEIKKRIGYMSQRFSLYDDLTVAENIRLFAGIYGMRTKEINERLEDALREIELTGHRDSLVSSLPIGWKQRLAFATAIFHRPQIVFLDEPTGGVDPAARKQFWELIYRTARRGITVFVTTHYMEEAEYCHRVSIMVDGRIEALDTPEALKHRYQSDTLDQVFQQLARKAVRQSD